MKLSAEMINHCLLVGLRRGMTEDVILADVDKLEGILTRCEGSVVVSPGDPNVPIRRERVEDFR